MARFDFQSPGAAFTGQITEALARRKAEERQQLLDQLTVNAEGRAKEEATRQAQQFELGQKATQQQIELNRAKVLGSNLSMGDDPLSRGMAQEDVDLLRKYGFLAELPPEPSVSTDTQFSAPEGSGLTMEPNGGNIPSSTPPPAAPKPKRYGYVGSEADRERKRKQDLTAQFIFGILSDNDPKNDYLAKAAEQNAMLNDGIASGDFMNSLMQPDIPVNIFDQDTGKVTSGGMVSPRSQFLTRTRPPREYKPRNMTQALDPDGNLVMIDQESIPVGPDGVAKLPPGYTAVRSGSGNQDHPLGIANNTFDAYIDELSVAEPDETGKIAAGPMLAIRQRAAHIISNAKATPAVKEIARKFIINPNSIGDETLSEKESLQLRQLLSVLAATPEVANMYRQNAIQTAPRQVAPNPQKPGDMLQNLTPSTERYPGGRR